MKNELLKKRQTLIKRINIIDVECAVLRSKISPAIHNIPIRMQMFGGNTRFKFERDQVRGKIKQLKINRFEAEKALKRLNKTIANFNRENNGGELV